MNHFINFLQTQFNSTPRFIYDFEIHLCMQFDLIPMFCGFFSILEKQTYVETLIPTPPHHILILICL